MNVYQNEGSARDTMIGSDVSARPSVIRDLRHCVVPRRTTQALQTLVIAATFRRAAE